MENDNGIASTHNSMMLFFYPDGGEVSAFCTNDPTNSFIQQSLKLSAYYVLHIALGSSGLSINKTDLVPSFMVLTI